ncbi:MAG: hypothetical protein OXG46_10770 [Chloroflexi bacterium]|nr:hypothetical protein [Chloroflexota bacterium]
MENFSLPLLRNRAAEEVLPAITEYELVPKADLNHTNRIMRAKEAAELIFHAPDPDAVADYEPRNTEEVNAAIRRFAELFDGLPGLVTRVLDAARDSGDLVSSDRLQGLAEIVQNADDAGASQVRLCLRSNELLVSHDGNPVRLEHVLGFAMPWLSTKGNEASTFGRFGIGLTTLRSLSTVFEVHCPPYHLRIGEPTLSCIERPSLPAPFQQSSWTTLRVPIETGDVSSEEIEKWLDRWDDSSLLFLRHVSRVTLLSPKGQLLRNLALSRLPSGQVQVVGASTTPVVLHYRAEASDGRSWVVYDADFSSPTGESRKRKATDKTTPISVAFPLQPSKVGKIHAGLPVAGTDYPIFASAQFDPLTNRLGFADTKWNKELVPLVADLWSEAAVDLFSKDPRAAWHAMPIVRANEQDGQESFVKLIEEEIACRARRRVSARLSFPVFGQEDVSLSRLAVEVLPLEGILTDAEIAHLSGLPARLPLKVRDNTGRWRSVLNDWRSSGADLPAPVSVAQALDLIGNDSRSAQATIALAAAALNEGLEERLRELPCVVAHDGRRLVPPSASSPFGLAAAATPLGQQLGVVTRLHRAHLSDEKAAAAVLAWLEESGALLNGSDDRAAVYRLAAAGRSGQRLETSLTDDQAQALRDAFELMDPVERLEVGSQVGRAVSLDAFTYDGKQRRTVSAHPVDSYLPRRIDRDSESFAIAAEQTPGPKWISGKYAEVLRSPAGRQGIGAQRFLRLLGAATSPRVFPHPQLEWRFRDSRQGLSRSLPGGPDARRREMEKREATYTLLDYHSPDLQAVTEDIASERRKGQRRKRAAALLATLGRAWDRYLVDFAEVESADDYYQWHSRGLMPAFWLWQAGDIAWLDDESGTPRRPVELRTRTPGNEAIYGDGSPDYLHRDLYQPVRQALLRAIGVSGEPSRSELVDRLRRIRDGSGEAEASLSTSSLHREAAIVYKALAHDLQTATSRSALNSRQLRGAFQQGKGLLLTNLGWLPPRGVLAGPDIFRDYRAFAPQVAGTAPLWKALKLREPSPDDCLKVIHKIARKRSKPDRKDEGILLETLRQLALHYRNGIHVQPRRLSQLALWTSRGWLRERPVYATDDPILAQGLRNQLPLWEPGGELQQFHSLLVPLRVERLRTADAEVIDPTLADEDPEATDLFQTALSLLQEDLNRNDPHVAGSIRLPWETVGGFDVRVHPSLSLRIRTGLDSSGEEYVSETDAKVDDVLGSVFVSRSEVLLRVDGGGRALATLFEGNARRLAHAWRAACDQAEEGIEARSVELAAQRRERVRARTEQEINSRTTSFRELTAATSTGNGRSAKAASSAGGARRGQEGNPKAIDLGPPRVLVDTSSLAIVDPRGRIEQRKNKALREKGRSGKLVDPAPVSSPPRNRSPIRGYSNKDKEDVGMELVQRLLSSDHQEIVDLRNQRNVGADAIDSMKRFYELKVFAGPEPDQVSLTNSEWQRAKSDHQFFLIVVSAIEGIEARPKVRVFVDPLNQLQRTYSGPIKLSGVRSTESLVYDFAPSKSRDTSFGGEQ